MRMRFERVSRRRLESNNGRRVDIGALVPYAVPAMAKFMQEAIIRVEEEFVGDHGGARLEYGDVQPNWALQWARVANGLPDFLAETWPSIYGPSGVVALGAVTDFRLRGAFDATSEAYVEVQVDGAALARMARRKGLRKIWRTASNERHLTYVLQCMQAGYADEEVWEFAEHFGPGILSLMDFSKAGRW